MSQLGEGKSRTTPLEGTAWEGPPLGKLLGGCQEGRLPLPSSSLLLLSPQHATMPGRNTMHTHGMPGRMEGKTWHVCLSPNQPGRQQAGRKLGRQVVGRKSSSTGRKGRQKKARAGRYKRKKRASKNNATRARGKRKQSKACCMHAQWNKNIINAYHNNVKCHNVRLPSLTGRHKGRNNEMEGMPSRWQVRCRQAAGR